MVKLVICRKWDDPAIKVLLEKNEKEIKMEMQLEDFLKALVTEVGNPASMMTTNQLQNKLTKAATAVVNAMKAETGRIM